MRQLLTFIRKEFLHVFRDRKTLLMLFGLPIAQIVLFGFALSNEIKDSPDRPRRLFQRRGDHPPHR